MLKLLLIILLTAISLNGHTQQLWTALVPRYKVSDHFRVSFDNQLRFVPGFNDVKDLFTEPQLDIEPFNWLEFSTAYRYHLVPEGEQRISQDVTFTLFNERKVSPSLRTRAQREFKEEIENMLRWRGKLSYKHSDDLEPYLSYEIFYQLDDVKAVQQLRYTIGLRTEITRYLLLDLYYRSDREINKERPEHEYIIATGLILELHKLKKKTQP